MQADIDDRSQGPTMKAIVHIGRAKTGTTSIQRFLYANEDALAARKFAVVKPRFHPDSLLELAVAAHDFSDKTGSKPELDEIPNPARMAAAARDALAEVAGKDGIETVILSSEHIFPWLNSDKEIETLDTLLAQHFDERVYVCYMREPLGWVLSSYSQKLRNGVAADLRKYLRAAPRSATMDKLKQWHRLIGPDRMSFRLMDRAHLVGGDPVTDFAAFAGLEIAGLPRPSAAENPSLDLAAAIAVRALNKQAAAAGLHNETRKALVAAIEARTKGSARLGFPPGNWSEVTDWGSRFCDELREAFFPDIEVLFTSTPPSHSPATMQAANRKALEALAGLVVGAATSEG
jgi:hypothetical protein